MATLEEVEVNSEDVVVEDSTKDVIFTLTGMIKYISTIYYIL